MVTHQLKPQAVDDRHRCSNRAALSTLDSRILRAIGFLALGAALLCVVSLPGAWADDHLALNERDVVSQVFGDFSIDSAVAANIVEDRALEQISGLGQELLASQVEFKTIAGVVLWDEPRGVKSAQPAKPSQTVTIQRQVHAVSMRIQGR